MRSAITILSLSLVACAGQPPSEDATDAVSGKVDGVGAADATWVKATNADLTKGKFSWTCTDPRNQAVALEFTHKGSHVIDEKVNPYQLIKDGQPVPGVGRDIFDVNVGPMTFIDNQRVQFSLSLQDYSDIMSWTFLLQANPAFNKPQQVSYLAVMTGTFRSSDGDDLLHTDAGLLTCVVTSPK